MAPTQTQEKPVKTGGDDLDDGLELDAELFDYADADGSEGSIVDGDDIGGYMTDEEDKGPTVSGRKRKGSDSDEPSGTIDPEALKAEKKRRKKEKEKERKAKRIAQLPGETLSSGAATHLSVDQLSEMLLKSTRETFPAATPMEMEDIVIPGEYLVTLACSFPYNQPTICFPHPNIPFPHLSTMPSTHCQRDYEFVSRRLIQPSALIAVLKPLQTKKPAVSTPRVIILTLSGMRSADVVRAVKPQKGQGEVAKVRRFPTSRHTLLNLALCEALQVRRASQVPRQDTGVRRSWYPCPRGQAVV